MLKLTCTTKTSWFIVRREGRRRDGFPRVQPRPRACFVDDCAFTFPLVACRVLSCPVLSCPVASCRTVSVNSHARSRERVREATRRHPANPRTTLLASSLDSPLRFVGLSVSSACLSVFRGILRRVRNNLQHYKSYRNHVECDIFENHSWTSKRKRLLSHYRATIPLEFRQTFKFQLDHTNVTIGIQLSS